MVPFTGVWVLFVGGDVTVTPYDIASELVLPQMSVTPFTSMDSVAGISPDTSKFIRAAVPPGVY